MIRTQIVLEAEASRAVRGEAVRRGISVAELLRGTVAVALEERPRARRPWMRDAGALASGDRSAGRTVDEVVYGRGRPRGRVKTADTAS